MMYVSMSAAVLCLVDIIESVIHYIHICLGATGVEKLIQFGSTNLGKYRLVTFAPVVWSRETHPGKTMIAQLPPNSETTPSQLRNKVQVLFEQKHIYFMIVHAVLPNTITKTLTPPILLLEMNKSPWQNG